MSYEEGRLVDLESELRDSEKQVRNRERSRSLARERTMASRFRSLRDMRIILDPIDCVVFHGLTARRHVERITCIEVKSGRGRPTACQHSIADAVQHKRLDFQVCHIDEG